MKKIMMLIIFTTLLLVSININASVVTVEDGRVITEKISLLENDKVSFSANTTYDKSNWISTGYVTLPMGSSTTYTIDLNNVYDLFEHYDSSNVESVKINFLLGSYYTTVAEENEQWLSSNASWSKTTTDLTIDKTDLTAVAEIWWNVIGQSGGSPSTGYPGSLRLYKIDLEVTYLNAPYNGTIIGKVDGQPDWEQLPMTTSNPIDENEGGYGSSEFFHKSYDETLDVHFYDLLIKWDNQNYLIEDISLPFMYGDYAKGYYYTYNDGNGLDRYVWFFGDRNGVPLSAPQYDASWIIWNLSDGIYKVSENKTIHAKPYTVGNGITTYNQLYVDIIVPWDITDMLNITLNYDYRHHYLISLGESNYGAWQQVRGQMFVKNPDDYEWYDLPENIGTVALPWWIDMTGVFNMIFANNPNSLIGRYLAVNEVEDITAEANADYKREYADYMIANGKTTVNYTVENIFMSDFKAYKIFIGQFDKTGSNGIQARDIAIVQTTVVSEDRPYTVIYPKLDAATQPNPKVPGININLPGAKDFLKELGAKIWELILTFWYVAILVIAGFGVALFEKVMGKKIKSGSTRIIAFAVIAFIMYMLLKI